MFIFKHSVILHNIFQHQLSIDSDAYDTFYGVKKPIYRYKYIVIMQTLIILYLLSLMKLLIYYISKEVCGYARVTRMIIEQRQNNEN